MSQSQAPVGVLGGRYRTTVRKLRRSRSALSSTSSSTASMPGVLDDVGDPADRDVRRREALAAAGGQHRIADPRSRPNWGESAMKRTRGRGRRAEPVEHAGFAGHLDRFGSGRRRGRWSTWSSWSTRCGERDRQLDRIAAGVGTGGSSWSLGLVRASSWSTSWSSSTSSIGRPLGARSRVGHGARPSGTLRRRP